MGKKYVIDESTLTDIAEAIRLKKGTGDRISPEKFASEIEQIEDGQKIKAELWKSQSGTASGTILSLKDVSPIEHFLKIKLSSDTITDFSGVKLIKGGLNIWDECTEIGGISEKSGTNVNSTATLRSTNYIKVFPDTDYYIVCPGGLMQTGGLIQIYRYDENKNFIGYGSTGVENQLIRMQSNWHYIRFVIRAEYGTTYNNDICFSFYNSLNGVYEPYVETIEYSVNANGTVEGVTPIYPVTTLTTNENVLISCEYIKDAEKSIIPLIERINVTHIDIPYGTQIIGTNAIALSSLESLTIPNTVTTFYDNAVRGTKITEVVIPSSVTRISGSAFRDNTNLKKATFLNSGSLILGANSFTNCPACLEYDFSQCAKIPQVSTSDFFTGINPNAKIIVPEDLYTQWVTATNWATYRNYITSKVIIPYGEEWGGITRINDVWAYGESSLYVFESFTPLKAYCKDLVSGDVSEITSENLLFGVWDFEYYVYTDGSGEVSCRFVSRNTSDRAFLSVGRWEIWVENSNGVKIYSRILEVAE